MTNQFFQVLGYDDKYMYFIRNYDFCGEIGEIVKISRHPKKRDFLFELAPIDFWRVFFPYQAKSHNAWKFSMRNAYDSLFLKATEAGRINHGSGQKRT
jgi:hypothetical protein